MPINEGEFGSSSCRDWSLTLDKIMSWKKLTGSDVSIESDITKSEVRFILPIINANQRQLTPKGVDVVEKSLLEQV